MNTPYSKIAYRIFFSGILLFSTIAFSKSWVFNFAENSKSADICLDAYLTYAGFNTSLINEKPVILDVDAEQGTYSYMLKNFHKPRSLRLEVSTNPMPLLGAYLYYEQPQWYANEGEVAIQTGIIRGVSAGFPDPGAISFFLGNKAFLGDYNTGKILGVFYGGFLLNYGNYHILNNNLYPDHWFEGEMKLKGEALGDKSNFSTSYRMGGKLHLHDDIKNTLFISIKRDRTDKDYTGWSPAKNSNIEFRVDLAPGDFISNFKDIRFAKFTAVAGKKVPYAKGKYIFSLSLGIEWISINGYTEDFYERSLLPGEQGETERSKLNIIFRPNVSF